jgi:hypothetical protein
MASHGAAQLEMFVVHERDCERPMSEQQAE